MSSQEIVNWLVPKSPIFIEVSTVPPVLIEISVCEFQKFGKDIEEIMENSEKEHNPKSSTWK
jgi:hypothetical protein